MASIENLQAIAAEKVFKKSKYDAAEAAYYSCLGGKQPSSVGGSPLTEQLAHLRANIQAARDLDPSSCAKAGGKGSNAGQQGDQKIQDMAARMEKMEAEMEKLRITVSTLNSRLNEAFSQGFTPSSAQAPAPTPKPEPMEEDDDDEVDLFGSDDEEEDAEAAKVREQRLAAYAEKKSKKAGPIAKSSVLLDVKPWSDETDLVAMEKEIREITMDGLIWGAAKSVPLAYGVHKLSILCTVEDEKVSIDDLSEKIEELEEHVQSVDIAAFNKI